MGEGEGEGAWEGGRGRGRGREREGATHREMQRYRGIKVTSTQNCLQYCTWFLPGQ